jgi:hypothetical protein
MLLGISSWTWSAASLARPTAVGAVRVRRSRGRYAPSTEKEMQGWLVSGEGATELNQGWRSFGLSLCDLYGLYVL